MDSYSRILYSIPDHNYPKKIISLTSSPGNSLDFYTHTIMIYTHYDKNFKRVGTSMDSTTSMILRGLIILLILILPIYPVVWIALYFKFGFKAFGKVQWILHGILIAWLWVVIGYQVSKDKPAEGVFHNLPEWTYQDENGEKITEIKGIDY